MMGVIVIIILALLMTLLLKMIKKYTHNMALMSRHIIRDSYSNVGRFFCSPAPPKIYENTCCGFFFQLWELI